MSFDYKRLSKTIAHALRHKPESYDLVLDQDGWVPLDALVSAIASKRQGWRNLTAEDIRAMTAAAEKQRYEITGDHIRALYGHSLQPELLENPPHLHFSFFMAQYPLPFRRFGGKGYSRCDVNMCICHPIRRLPIWSPAAAHPPR